MEAESVPMSPVLAGEDDAIGRALNDGEDFELLFTLHPETDVEAFKSDWARNLESKLTHIGTIKKGAEGLVLKNAPSNFSAKGYEHLK